MADPRIFMNQDGIIKMELHDDDDDDDDDEDEEEEYETSLEESKSSHHGDGRNSMLQHCDAAVRIHNKSISRSKNSEERNKVSYSKVASGVGVGSVLSLSLTAKKKDPGAVKSAPMRRQLPLSKKRRLEFPIQEVPSSSPASGDGNITKEGIRRQVKEDLPGKHGPLIVQATVLSNDEENDSQDENDIVEAIPMSDDSDEGEDDDDNKSLKVTPSSKSRKFRPSMSTPLVATPSISSDKRVLLHTGPAESLPSGWTEKLYKRTTGLQHTDRYWYSPLLKKKFRSLAQVSRFLDLLKKEHGDEAKAWELFRMNPPGPDETRSKQRLPGGCEVGNIKGQAKIKNENFVSPKKSRGSGGGGGGKKKEWTIPPIASPGLYVVPPSSVTQLYRSQQKQATQLGQGKGHDDDDDDDEAPVIELNDDGYIAPSLLFDHALYEAGFSKKKMSQAKHYGSSILWTVDDIFSRDFSLIDTDIMPEHHFHQITNDEAFCDTKSLSSKRGLQFDDMIPTSLKISLPKSYIDAKQEYVRKVTEREHKLKEYHKQLDANEDAMDAYEMSLHEWQVRKKLYEKNNQRSQRIKPESLHNETKQEDTSDRTPTCSTIEDFSTIPGDSQELQDRSEEKNSKTINNSVYEQEIAPYGPKPVPPIPSPLVEFPPILAPPSLSEYLKNDQQLSNYEINPLLSMQESERSRLAHLDPKSFMIDGRYYGLFTNNIADPQFVGPHAPGISGLSHINNKVHTTVSTISPLVSSSKPIKNVGGDNSKSLKTQMPLTTSKTEHLPIKKPQSKLKSNSYAQLKQIIGRGGEEAESMRMSIIKAGVFASRNAIDMVTFIGANGETFQGLSKAFSNYSGCKPCVRCKGNKQGAYHCRLKRRHDDLDYDGGNSCSILAPLFLAPLEDLYQVNNHLGTERE
eukprot:CAMPEP_0176495564 /NCGR_PEP_ID=MMETSP0200_2-20121128/10723_1 /TAXON_ID=947934 /ORGANISM="Chaetoceros sp., Strain GSL56" /LENGTH=908 /DNA_ID=CAMNT_0017893449 /DNA_START=153 /DNA_END=2879 /DNA_ORIENTATION=-